MIQYNVYIYNISKTDPKICLICIDDDVKLCDLNRISFDWLLQSVSDFNDLSELIQNHSLLGWWAKCKRQKPNIS